jgi:hypothetical protein
MSGSVYERTKSAYASKLQTILQRVMKHVQTFNRKKIVLTDVEASLRYLKYDKLVTSDSDSELPSNFPKATFKKDMKDIMHTTVGPNLTLSDQAVNGLMVFMTKYLIRYILPFSQILPDKPRQEQLTELSENSLAHSEQSLSEEPLTGRQMSEFEFTPATETPPTQTPESPPWQFSLTPPQSPNFSLSMPTFSEFTPTPLSQFAQEQYSLSPPQAPKKKKKKKKKRKLQRSNATARSLHKKTLN